MITAIILAAGKSTRLGTPKQLLSYQGTPMIRLTVNTLLQAPIDKVIVVLGHEASKIADAINGMPVIATINNNYHNGQSTSIKSGLSVYKKLIQYDSPQPDTGTGLNGIMFCLCDQPLLKPETINLLVDRFYHSGGIVVPYFQNTRGNPVIFDARLIPQFDLLKGDIGAREIIFSNPQKTTRIDVEDQGVIFDIDTWEDYNKLQAAELVKEALECRDLP